MVGWRSTKSAIGGVDSSAARRLPNQIAEAVRLLVDGLAMESGKCGLVLVGGHDSRDGPPPDRGKKVGPALRGWVRDVVSRRAGRRADRGRGPEGGASGDEAVLESVVNRLRAGV